MVLFGPEALGQTAISGIILGSLFALMAMGLTLVYATIRILNFSHGGLFTWGAFMVWWLVAPRVTATLGPDPYVSGLVLPFFFALPIALGIMLAMGMGIQQGIIRPLLTGDRLRYLNIVFATIALGLVLEGLSLLAFGPRTKNFVLIPRESWDIGANLYITNEQVAQLAIAVLALALMHVFLKRHRHGLAMRAVSQDTEMANLVGVRVRRIFLYTFAISTILAALSGILLSNIIFISPAVGLLPMTKAFIIIIFGGIGSITGTVYASYVLGFIEAFTALFIGIAWALPVEFAFMVIVLALRPQGLFGFKE